jgi:hypothetical protein
MARPEAGGSSEQTGRGDCGIEGDSEAGLEKLVGDTEADEVVVVTDIHKRADRLHSYRRVAPAFGGRERTSEVATREDRPALKQISTT